MAKNDYYLVKETKDLIQECGEVLTDYHKGDYSTEYKILSGNRFKTGEYIIESDLFRYTLLKLPNKKVSEILYGLN